MIWILWRARVSINKFFFVLEEKMFRNIYSDNNFRKISKKQLGKFEVSTKKSFLSIFSQQLIKTKVLHF